MHLRGVLHERDIYPEEDICGKGRGGAHLRAVEPIADGQMRYGYTSLFIVWVVFNSRYSIYVDSMRVPPLIWQRVARS